MFKEEKEMRAN
jgi:hypothetical protein